MNPPSFYNLPAVSLAQALLGCELIHRDGAGAVGGIIVETEAYTQDDPASHAFGGRSQRNDVMFGPGGRLYVYFTYGMHHCCNVVAGAVGRAEAVLIRALEPTHGIMLMEARRRTTQRHNLCNGPAKLVQALGITAAHNGASLCTPQLHIKPRTSAPRIMAGPRIGISRAVDTPWRFFIAENSFVISHKFNKRSLPLDT